MQEKQRNLIYLERCEEALLQVARKVARAMGIQSDVHAMSTQSIHCALLDKSTALFEQGGDDTKFQQRLAERNHHYGSLTPYHPDFSEALRAQVLQCPLQEVGLYMNELLKVNPPLRDAFGLNYLLDTLQDTTQLSKRLERAIFWLSKQKAEEITHVADLPIIELQPYEFSISEETLSKIDILAENMGLISEGAFILGERKKSALVGFHQALKEAGWIGGTYDERNAFFGNRYSISLIQNTYRGTKTGEAYHRKTNKILKQTSSVTL
ncbi:hypothetical protein [Hymenobacter bucti]|uniref:Antirepressor protein C-terminal domain-containing protein n=1 Tax=Hymenobacter bucti TaxID=1844114 RepID=A0ABW4QZ46_9BACT